MLESAWDRARRAEAAYSAQLRRIARHVGELSKSLAATPEKLITILKNYGEILEPWAESVATRMVEDVARRDEAIWRSRANELSFALRSQLGSTPLGLDVRALIGEQKALIKSLPLEAAHRIGHIISTAPATGRRAEDVAKLIAESGQVSRARARVIARTEIGRASVAIMQARAQRIGSQGYVWRTSRDQQVRPSHRKMEGQYVPWNSPPMLDGLIGHAGAIVNCRCWAEPILPKR